MCFYNWFAQIKIQTRKTGVYVFIHLTIHLTSSQVTRAMGKEAVSDIYHQSQNPLWRRKKSSVVRAPENNQSFYPQSSFEFFRTTDGCCHVKTRSSTIQERPFTTRLWTQTGEQLLWSHNIQLASVILMKPVFQAPHMNTRPKLRRKLYVASFASSLTFCVSHHGCWFPSLSKGRTMYPNSVLPHTDSWRQRIVSWPAGHLTSFYYIINECFCLLQLWSPEGRAFILFICGFPIPAQHLVHSRPLNKCV